MHREEFRRTVLGYYSAHKRILPWREKITDYGVFLSEIMLQQTQVARVLVKYPEFIARFPDIHSLASAPLPSVLEAWQGLGYNRRGMYLRASARILVEQYSGKLPQSVEIVDGLPGVGRATACALVTYIHNIPTVFIETNIRRVFLHHYFSDRADISDKELVPFIAETLDQENPREWYYALMDYGTHLARIVPNPNRRSLHYAVQSRFAGSVRKSRGEIVRYLLKYGGVSYEIIRDAMPAGRVEEALAGMLKDGIVELRGSLYFLRE